MKREEYLGQRFHRHTHGELVGGPSACRRPTDVACLLIFLAQALAFWTLAGAALRGGRPQNLFGEGDHRGGRCGGPDLPGHRLAFSASVEAIDEAAMAILCEAAPRANLAGLWFKEACEGGGEREASGGDGAWDLRGVLNGTAAPERWSRAFRQGRNFNRVCVTSCRLGGAATRQYDYVPPPDAPWAAGWAALVAFAEASGDSEMQGRLGALRFRAWDRRVCPYPARYCIPFPGAAFYEGAGGVCLAQPDKATAQAADMRPAETAELRKSFRLSALGGRAEDLGTAVGHLYEIFDVLGMVSAMAMLAGLIVTLVMRFWPRSAVVGGAASVPLLLLAVAFLGSRFKRYAAQGPVGAAEGILVLGWPLKISLDLFSGVLYPLAALWLLRLFLFGNDVWTLADAGPVAAQFVCEVPQVLLVPVLLASAGILLALLGISVVACLLTDAPHGAPAGAFRTEAEASAACLAGAQAWRDQVDCEGGPGDARCWRCAPPVYRADLRVVFALLSLVWQSRFLVDLGRVVVAGAACLWFFKEPSEKDRGSKLLPSLKHALLYHAGSIALGSVILGPLRPVHGWVRGLSRAAKAANPRLAAQVLRPLCRCIRYEVGAYVQVALQGTDLCASAKSAFFLVARNSTRFHPVSALGSTLDLIMTCLIALLTAAAGYFTTVALYPEVSLLGPVVVHALIGYVVGKPFVAIFAMALDATMQCLMVVEEMHHRGDFVPEELREFIRARDQRILSSVAVSPAPSSGAGGR